MYSEPVMVRWQLAGRTVEHKVPPRRLPSVDDHVTFTGSSRIAQELGQGTYRVLARTFHEGASCDVTIVLEPAEVPVPPDAIGLWEALEPIARSASNVLGDDGYWCASDRIKDWFDYDDLERVLRVAGQHGWTPPGDDD